MFLLWVSSARRVAAGSQMSHALGSHIRVAWRRDLGVEPGPHEFDGAFCCTLACLHPFCTAHMPGRAAFKLGHVLGVALWGEVQGSPSPVLGGCGSFAHRSS